MGRTQNLSILVTIATELTEKSLFFYTKSWFLLYVPCERFRDQSFSDIYFIFGMVMGYGEEATSIDFGNHSN